MSAAMVNLGVYGIVRVGLTCSAAGPAGGGCCVLALGAVSALYGILQAAVGTDLKRLLAYSTTENMGLVLLGVGAGGLFARRRQHAAGRAGADRGAAARESTMPRSRRCCSSRAGSVLHATGTRDLDALGGLRPGDAGHHRGVRARRAGAAALPPATAFVSEWLLLQALVHGLPAGRRGDGGH